MAHVSLAEIGARTTTSRGYSLGNTVAVTAALRMLADAIDSGAVMVAKAAETQTIAPDDFDTRTLAVSFYDKIGS